MTRADLEAAAEERYPHWILDPNDERGEDYSEMDAKWQNAEADMQRAAYVRGRLDQAKADALGVLDARRQLENAAIGLPLTSSSVADLVQALAMLDRIAAVIGKGVE